MRKIDYGMKNADREQFKWNFVDIDIPFISKRGIPNWNIISPSQSLLTSYTSSLPGKESLVIRFGHGAILVALSLNQPQNHFFAFDNNYICHLSANETLLINNIRNVEIVNDINKCFENNILYDRIYLDLPQGRQLVRRWLMESFQALKINGELLIAGANNFGINSIAQDANSLFGNLNLIALKKSNRIYRCIKSENKHLDPEWASLPGISSGSWISYDTVFQERKYSLFSFPGVFSSHRIDEGTKFLLENLSFQCKGRILDLGCGNGVIGILISQPGINQIDFIDVDYLALASAEKNVINNNITNARVFPSDGLFNVYDQSYQEIISNPPFHSGKEVDYSITQSFIIDSWKVLSKDGNLTIVANQFIAFGDLLKKYYSKVKVLASNRSYKIWQASK